MSQHTPGPWKLGISECRHLDGSPPTHNLIIVTESEELITDFGRPQKIGEPLLEKDRTNAEIIIRAVNLNAELVAALESLVERGTDSPVHNAALAVLSKAKGA